MKHNLKVTVAVGIAAIIGLILAWFQQHVMSLGWYLLATISLLSLVEEGGPRAKTNLTSFFGACAAFVFVTRWGIPAAPDGNVAKSFINLAHAMHLEIFVFLGGLYLVVNTFAYSGFIGDLAWKIVRKAGGKLGTIMIAIMILTCVLSGIFDGATIATIMGVITLTILLSSGMAMVDIVKILLLLVVATNIGGVWFVLGEPTNILAAEKLKLSPFYFLQYALPFSLVPAVLCAVATWHIVKKYPRIQSDRPDMEVLLEGISLRRTHKGTGTLSDTLVSIGNVELRSMKDMERVMQEEGLPDFEAALKVGIPRKKVYQALAINLNSEELALGLIDYYQYRADGDPMAEILIGDLVLHVREEYKARTRSRMLIIASGIVLIGLLIIHAILPAIPTWASTLVAGAMAILAVQPNARRYILNQTSHNLRETFFLIAIFITISEINMTGAFEQLGNQVLNLASPPIVGVGILASSAALSAVADNVAVIDVLTNLITHHVDWSFFALASIVGTALGGFASPIASVQAVIMATIIRRVAKVSFGAWVGHTIVYFLILLAISCLILVGMYYLGLPPQMPMITQPMP